MGERHTVQGEFGSRVYLVERKGTGEMDRETETEVGGRKERWGRRESGSSHLCRRGMGRERAHREGRGNGQGLSLKATGYPGAG